MPGHPFSPPGDGAEPSGGRIPGMHNIRPQSPHAPYELPIGKWIERPSARHDRGFNPGGGEFFEPRRASIERTHVDVDATLPQRFREYEKLRGRARVIERI